MTSFPTPTISPGKLVALLRAKPSYLFYGSYWYCLSPLSTVATFPLALGSSFLACIRPGFLIAIFSACHPLVAGFLLILPFASEDGGDFIKIRANPNIPTSKTDYNLNPLHNNIPDTDSVTK
jgi:hypothetical protein